MQEEIQKVKFTEERERGHSKGRAQICKCKCVDKYHSLVSTSECALKVSVTENKMLMSKQYWSKSIRVTVFE